MDRVPSPSMRPQTHAHRPPIRAWKQTRVARYVPVPMVGIHAVWIQSNRALEFTAASCQIPLRPEVNKPQAGMGFIYFWIEFRRLRCGRKRTRIGLRFGHGSKLA